MLENSLELLAQNQLLLCLIVAIFSLCVGSFLNVVIYRLPIILKREWHNECQLFLHADNPQLDHSKFTLSFPRSKCPTCESQIKWYQNIPVISWLALRGKCSSCKTGISIRYPLIELLTCVLSVIIVVKFGFSLKSLFGVLFTWMLIPLLFIDFAEQILPDRIVFPLIGIGLAINTHGVFVATDVSVWGCIIGFLSLWSVYIIYKLITGKEGMGYGDFKLLAAFGAWFGAGVLPTIILGSSIIGSLVGIYFLRVRKQSLPFAFGPYLVLAGWVAFFFGPLV